MSKRSSTSTKSNVSESKTKKKSSSDVVKSRRTSVVKKTSKSSAKTKTKRSSTASSTAEVRLPSNMSQRAITKSLTYKAYFKKIAAPVALTVATLCMLVGSAVALFSSFNPTVQLQVANLCLSGTCTTTTDTTVIDSTLQTNTATQPQTLVQPSAVVQLQDPLPKTIDTIVNLKLVTQYVSSITAQLESAAGQRTAIVVKPVTADLYQLTIPGDTLTPDTYALRARADGLDGTRYTFALGMFTVPERIETQNTQATQSTTSDSTVSDDSSSTASSTGQQTTLTSSDRLSTEETNSDFSLVKSENSIDTNSAEIAIHTPTSIVANTVILPISAPTDLSFIEIYGRRIDSTESQFLGLADNTFGYWRFNFNSRLLPNGEYLLFAKVPKTVLSNNVSNTLQITIKNSTIDSTLSSLESTVTTPSTKTDTITEPVRLQEASVPVIIPDESTATHTTRLFTSFESDIETALKQYAVAVRTGDVSLIVAAEENVSEVRRAMTAEASRSESFAVEHEEITGHFDSLLDRIATVEQLRTKRANKPIIDTDNDGINDVDEEILYGTDPRSADTDRDGFTDGIEIIRGFDPLNANSEAEVVYELPSESAVLIREDLLTVDSVAPQLRSLGVENMTMVESVITGTALPNSFVTLYIFSTPIIVTVSTDDDGSYEFTLSKELADGTHDVYAAITDNTGAIVARSEVFSFVKEANAYSPVQSDSGLSAAPASVTMITARSYATTFGLALLAFGALLFFLGTGLRRHLFNTANATT